ncbi:hypothetical protein GCK72_004933 [Caenorhabditis remanei]|uniref:Uncharacterized protein n=1 Tax=Caenorhabditis remanei TaxID=31234 RepID=A0A6A5HFN9_CAERE|nr:hypothetical protein GCK72_004933 [Caenorhabditis remanei]KAF1764982.1 hypothetical protein GCK72_004933 [Caenorhabditis remanei]
MPKFFILGCLLIHFSPGTTSILKHSIRDSNGVIVENDNDVCDAMCYSNYSDIVVSFGLRIEKRGIWGLGNGTDYGLIPYQKTCFKEECKYGCHHRTGIRERLNPFQSCLGACEARFRVNFAENENNTDFINRAWEACLHACRLPYKTKIRWNVYIDLRSGEPIWNFERIISDGHRISSEALEYDDLISTVVLRKNHFFMDPSSKLRFPNLNVYDADSRAMQTIMMEMLEKVRQEISSMSPRRFDGISSIDYVGPRLVEHGPNGPIVKDITELQYRPKEVIIYQSGEFREQHFTLMSFMFVMMSSVMLCACMKLRSQYLAFKTTRLRRSSSTTQSDDWTKQIPTTGEAPPCYSPPDRNSSIQLMKNNSR